MGELVSMPTPAARLAEAMNHLRECRVIQNVAQRFRAELVFSDDCPVSRWVLFDLLKRVNIAFDDGEEVICYAIAEVNSRDPRHYELVGKVWEWLENDDERVPPFRHLAFVAGRYVHVVPYGPAR